MPDRIPSTVSKWNTKVIFTASVLAFAAYYFLDHKGEQTLPDTYALCSRDKKIYTVDEDNQAVECIIINGSSIVYSGDLETATVKFSSRNGNAGLAVRYIPDGSIAIPGISDSHCHILEYGASRQIPLSEGRTLKETILIIREYIQSNPDLEGNKSRIVEGWGWDHASWDVEKMPTWEDLEADAVVAGRRVILQSRDGHAIWVSQRTLLENGPYPDVTPGGVIIRDEEGNPTGVFMDSAQDLITRAPLTDEEMEQRFQRTVKEALAVGLTSLHDAGLQPDSLAFFKRQAERRRLPIRIYGMTYFDEEGPYWGDKNEAFMSPTKDRLSSRSVKIFADGALRSGLYEPYADNPSTRGVMRISAELLNTVIPRFLRMAGKLYNVHAIGDRANAIVLDAFELALKGVNVTSSRPRLEHAQIMKKEDMRRLGELGVIASIQPTHAISDMWFAQDRLGPERVKGLYAFRDIIDSGARITLGSDFPVDEINPLKGFYAAITRLSVDGTSPHGDGGWFPNQRLSRMEALRGMTIDPAYASFTEDILGSLTPGKRADYVILSSDITTIPPENVLQTKVLATAIDGKIVFGAL
ncbi:amidohydrolase family-domain-containing protein [Gymnopilus junonius]|uniref:Amidohydrolase family-domain-containing protein n=1 Tax=Gymnopilus junonius TaxID=109634 RepID=A0A9P5ND27_GYMJU|nr:amidohydrolase family-domain-containing protein [Gymnopilus junonius]